MLILERVILRQEGFSLAADWRVPEAARVALIGPSGEGKSTLLLAIAGFLAPAEGRILWQGQDLAALSPAMRPVSILFQDQNLFPHLSVADNVALALSPRLRLTPAQWQAVADSLERVGLSGLGPRKPAQLSGGQIGRAALARVLLRARPLLLLDEPFAALGPGMKQEMLALVAEVAAATGATVLMVTHDPRDAEEFAELTVLVDAGTAQPPQPTRALFADPPAGLRAYLGKPK
jgi:thiamine transport system ATP-binding protein